MSALSEEQAAAIGMALAEGLGREPTRAEFDAVAEVFNQTLVDAALAEAVFRGQLAITWDGESVRYKAAHG